MNKLEISGCAHLSVKPDTIQIECTISTLAPDYSTSVHENQKQYESLVMALQRQGLKKEDIKTSSFTINEEYEIINGKSVFSGYRCNHSIIIKIPLDMDLLASIITAIDSSVATPNISIRFTIENDELVRQELIVLAIENAMTSAKTIAQATGVVLGNIESIQYSCREMNYYSQSNVPAFKAAKEMSFTPTDVELSEHINISWYI